MLSLHPDRGVFGLEPTTLAAPGYTESFPEELIEVNPASLDLTWRRSGIYEPYVSFGQLTFCRMGCRMGCRTPLKWDSTDPPFALRMGCRTPLKWDSTDPPFALDQGSVSIVLCLIYWLALVTQEAFGTLSDPSIIVGHPTRHPTRSLNKPPAPYWAPYSASYSVLAKQTLNPLSPGEFKGGPKA
jgi:hypothetical protein